MKHRILTNILRLAIVGILSVAAPAVVMAEPVVEETVNADETFTEGDYTFQIVSGRVAVKKYNGTAAEITIPVETAQGAVDTVLAGAYADNTGIKKVTIPYQIKKLEDVAFKNCTGLEEVVIQADLAKASNDSSSPTWDYSARSSIFFNAGSSKGLKVTFEGDKIQTIPANLFATGKDKSENVYAKVTEVVINAPVKNIEYNAFYRCYDLQKVTFNDKLISIGNSAFSEDVSIKELSFPDSLTELGEYAFYNNDSLTTLLLNKNINKCGKSAFASCSELKELTIDGSTTFGEYCFDEDSKIETVTINGNANLGSAAFRNCAKLSALNINGNLANAPSDSHSQGWDYSYKASPFWNAGVTNDGITVTFGEGVTLIPNDLFATGKEKSENTYARVKTVIIPDTVTEIGSHAFFRCYDLESVTFGKKIKLIKAAAFEHCTSLTKIELPDALTEINEYAFHNTGVISLTTGKFLKKVDNNVFAECPEMTTLAINGATTFGTGAFYKNTALETIVINGNVNLGANAFRECTKIKDLTIAGNIGNCPRDSVNEYWDYSLNSAVFADTGRNQEEFNVVFKEGVTVIPEYLFATGKPQADNIYCRISSVYIPVSVKSIGQYAFHNCYDLKNVQFGGTKARLGELLKNEKGEDVPGNDLLKSEQVSKKFEDKKYNPKDWQDPSGPENPNPDVPSDTVSINDGEDLVVKQKVNVSAYFSSVSGSVKYAVLPKGVGAVKKGEFTAKKPCSEIISITAYTKDDLGQRKDLKTVIITEKIVKPQITKKFERNKPGVTISANEIITGTYPKVTSWVSSKPEVASVDSVTGTVTIGSKCGSTKITAIFGNAKYTTTVKVKVPVLKDMKLKVGAIKPVKVKNLTTTVSSWKSSDETVAKVDATGYVTAIKPGSAKLTAVIDGVEYHCVVAVK